MLTYQDCVGLGHLTEDEIRAIAEHEHVPEIIALELGEYLVQDADGILKIRRIIIEDIEAAGREGRIGDLEKLRMVLAHFISTHPEHPG